MDKSERTPLTRRRLLLGVAAIPVAASLPHLPIIKGQELKKIDVVSNEFVLKQILKFREALNKRDEEFKQYINDKVKGDPKERSRVEYAQDYFLTTKAINMLPRVQAMLALIAPGLALQESGYKADRESEAGAYGIWQITKSLIVDLNEVRSKRSETLFEYQRMNEMIHSTEAAFYAFDNIFYVKIFTPAMELAKRYGLSDDGAEDFAVFCMINAYNTGSKRMGNVLNAFMKDHDPSSFVAKDDSTPLALFYTITDWVYRNKKVRGYGEDSFEYIQKVLAGAEYLGRGTLDKKLVSQIPKTAPDIKDKILGYVGMAGLGAATSSAIVLAGELSTKKKENSDSQDFQADSITRRELLRTMSTTAVAGASIATLSNYVPFWWQRGIGQEAKQVVEIEFPDGSIYAPERVGKRFTEIKSAGKNFISGEVPEAIVLPRRNYTEVVKPFLKKIEGEYPQISDKDLEVLKTNDKYTVPEEVNRLWRLRGIGSGNKDTPKNNMQYALVAKDTEVLMRMVTEDFQSQLAGLLPEGWFVRPVINSLTRTQEMNARVPNSSRVSAHMNGLAFDISDARFDTGYEEDGVSFFTELAKLDQNAEIRRDLRKVMSNILKTYHLEDLAPVDAPRAIITHEPKSLHYHITVRPRGK